LLACLLACLLAKAFYRLWHSLSTPFVKKVKFSIRIITHSIKKVKGNFGNLIIFAPILTISNLSTYTVVI